MYPGVTDRLRAAVLTPGIVASIDANNRDMQIVSERVGFTVSYDPHEQLMKARIDL
jgi:hypothetical protein